MSGETVNDSPMIDVEAPTANGIPASTAGEEIISIAENVGDEDDISDANDESVPGAPKILDEADVDALVEESLRESEATDQKIATLEAKLVELCREAIHTTSPRVLARCEGELQGLMQRLNDLRHEVVFLPIAQRVCPHAAAPALQPDTKEFCRSVLVPQRIYGPDYVDRVQVHGFTKPTWMTSSEQQAFLDAYRSSSRAKERICQLDMRCQDTQRMIWKFQRLAGRTKKR